MQILFVLFSLLSEFFLGCGVGAGGPSTPARSGAGSCLDMGHYRGHRPLPWAGGVTDHRGKATSAQ